MPYHIGEQGSYGCKGYPVVKDSDGTVMGCHDSKESAKKQLAALYVNEPEASKAASFVAPAEVRANAKRGLELRDKYNRGGTEVGVARARDLSNGSGLSFDTIKRMNSFFARHEVDKQGEGWGKDSAGYIAWLLWGGDAGWAWAKRIIRENENREKSSMSNLTTAFFGIEKADRNADGTMTVYGKATDDSIDIDQQICDGDWLDRAMPHWFKSGGNIREQHSNIAAGVATDYEAKADGHYISALVVDPVSVKKVETGVLKGFSIGIKNPRVTRDKSAMNGRIVDGQIVEVSLVDRPANPNCQLVLAKSASGDETVVQVEDLIEAEVLQSEDTNTEEGTPMATETISVPKSIVGDILKFDKVQFEAARDALANLVQIEAGEMKEGHNEIQSLSHLLESIAHLHAWYEGEEAEGEVVEEETIELAAEKNAHIKSTVGCDCAGCTKCGKAGGCKDAMCKMHDGKSMTKTNATEDSAATGAEDLIVEEKSANMDKCLECGCHKPEETHGRVDVTTADMVAPSETPKSAETDEVVTELEDQELPAEATEEAATDNSTEDNSADLNAIVEQVVESATKALKSEIASLVAAKEAAQEKAVGLETELAQAKSLAVAGGPKRTARPLGGTSNELVLKAATYKAKANAATDPDLAKGYKALADKFYAEATETLNK
jgi:hypothetical protein